MKFLTTILLAIICMCSYPQSNKPFFILDANGKVITTSDGFPLAVIDTASSQLVLPPDTAQIFIISMAASDTFSSLKTEIRAYYALEEAAGDAIDSVGTVDLPVIGNVTWGATGVIGDCIEFIDDGYLGNIDTEFEFGGSFSLSCQIKTASTGQYDGLITNYVQPIQFGDTYGWDLIRDNGGASASMIEWNLRSPGGSTTVYGTTAINDNAFHHVVTSYNSVDDTMKVYIDGVLEDKDVHDGPYYHEDSRLWIGDRNDWYDLAYTGLMDEIGIWNKELTQAEVDSLFVLSQYPFGTEGSGGDSLRMRLQELDARADTVRVNSKLSGYPTSRTDGDLDFAFNMVDSADFADTTFYYADKKDTIRYYAAWTGLIPEDTWTAVPNKDTVLIDSSDIWPPGQDYPGWYTLFEQDFEAHTGVPKDYITSEWTPNWRGTTYRWSDNSYPGWWTTSTTIDDSIVIDPITDSQVMKFCFEDGFYDGYWGEGPARGGDHWEMDFDFDSTEVYFSYNILLRPGWVWPDGGGKLPGVAGGPWFAHGQPGLPDENDGFTAQLIWDWETAREWPDGRAGTIGWYLYWQDKPPTSPYGSFMPWSDFQPVGEGLQYNDDGRWVFGTGPGTSDSIWVNITMRCVINTFTGVTPNHDGILEGFINGHLIERLSGLMLLAYPNRTEGVDRIFISHFFGGGPHPLRDEWTWFDDFVAFTYREDVEDIPRGNELSEPGRVLDLPNWPKIQDE